MEYSHTKPLDRSIVRGGGGGIRGVGGEKEGGAGGKMGEKGIPLL